MDHSIRPNDSVPHPPCALSRENMQRIFTASIMELYFANQAIGRAFREVRNFIVSPQLEAVLRKHYEIHLIHKYRLERIFHLQNRPAETKDCHAVNAILSQSMEYLAMFSEDIRNLEVSLLLTSRKLAHYKIAAYGSAAHLALSLQHDQAATLLAIGAQEEEEFIERDLNILTDRFLTPL